MEIAGLFPIPVGVTHLDRDLTEIEKKCLKRISKIVKANEFNTTSSNSYVLNEPDLKFLKEFIESKLIEYINKTNPSKNKLGIYITQSWVNYTNKNQSHHRHLHPNSFVSGVFYVNAKKEHDRIVFFKQDTRMLQYTTTEHNIFNSIEWQVPVETNLLILFPSSLSHYVTINNQNYVRESLSFNTFIKGNLGEESSLTGLIL